MRRRRRSAGNMEEGQDSFLDVISNMVGILIILVMIAGVRASKSSSAVAEPERVEPEPVQQAAAEPPVEPKAERASDDLLRELADREKKFHDDQATNRELRDGMESTRSMLAQVQRKIAAQADESAGLLDALGTVKAALEIHEEELEGAEKEMFRLQFQKAEADAKLAESAQQRKWLQEHRPTATVIENRPTPLGTTVEGKEAHFRLLGGRLGFVPYDSLVEKMKADIGLHRRDFFAKPVSTGTVGPVEGYRLRYKVVCFDVNGPEGIGKRLELDLIEFDPAGDTPGTPTGETIDEAMRENSDLMQRLARYVQDIYTVTVWVYPDSFEDFSRLKQFLYRRGYKIAARPLEIGQPISASPRGTKSTAQ